jgi:hypothetical protein
VTAAQVISALILALATLVRPRHAACPERHDLRTGIRRSGHFECWPAVVGDPEADGTWGHPERGTQPPGIVTGRIYCAPQTVPVVRDQREVLCRRP